MDDEVRDETEYYNLEGGQRHLIVKDGDVKAVAPGLWVVEATEEEKQRVRAKAPRRPPREYGLPV